MEVAAINASALRCFCASVLPAARYDMVDLGRPDQRIASAGYGRRCSTPATLSKISGFTTCADIQIQIYEEYYDVGAVE